jgi:hypothetical protein
MKKFPVALILLLGTLDVAPMFAQSPKYPPLNEYLMARDVEIALAKSAAPDYISDHATIKVFTASGFQTVHEGDRLCMRSHARVYRSSDVHSGASPGLPQLRRENPCSHLPRPTGRASGTALLRTSDKTGVGRQDGRANCRGGTSRLHQRRDPKASRSVFCLHVVGGPSARADGPLASAYHGLPSLLREPAGHQTPSKPCSVYRGR